MDSALLPSVQNQFLIHAFIAMLCFPEAIIIIFRCGGLPPRPEYMILEFARAKVAPKRLIV